MNNDVWQVFKNCPRCGATLILEHNHDGPVLRCSNDGHIFYQNPHTAVAAIIKNTAGKILLLKRAKDPKKNHWDFPGGFVNWGEAPEQAVIREVREELGVDFTIESIIATAHDWYLYKDMNTSVNAIDYQGTINGNITISDEIDSIEWFAPADLPQQEIAFPSVEKTINMLRPK